jgi:pimeloyl-ACP methyl ester carboxylesterase
VPISRVLLVHGAWHGAWCWDRVLELLRSSGYRPEAMDLPGHGDSPEPLGDLHRDADAVAARLDTIGEPTLLVGHSYGGMVITDAGSHEAVAALVYVCAFMPTAGQSLMDTWRGQRRPEGAAESDLLGCVRFTDDESAMYLEGDGVVSALYGDCDPPVQQWSLERLGQQLTASFTQVPRHVAWASKPTTYVVCTEDRSIPAWHQRRMAGNASRVAELTAGHSPFLSTPDTLTRVLADAANGVAPSP